MYIIKHKSRRHKLRVNYEDTGSFFVVNGVHSVGTAEEAVDIAVDVFSEQVKAAPKAKTIWETYGHAH